MTEILLIDNHDSFTHLLADLIWRASGIRPHILPNDAPSSHLDLTQTDLIVISPGPGTPSRENLGLSSLALEQSSVPVFGVCLGHQAIAAFAGAECTRAKYPMHGLSSAVTHSKEGLFAGLPSPLEVIRYHSLAVSDSPLLEILARADDGTIMAVKHRDKPQWGVQFHPESIGTSHGVQLIQNVMVEAGVATRWHRRQARLSDPADVVHAWDTYPYLCWLDSAGQADRHIIAAGSELVEGTRLPIGFLSATSAVTDLTFVPGVIGVLSYEATDGIDGGTFTEGVLLKADVVYEVVGEKAYLLTPEGCAEDVEATISTFRPTRSSQRFEITDPTIPSRDTYTDLVRECQGEIAAGNSYELCLTTKATATTSAEPLDLYRELRSISPSPMAGFFRSPELAVLSASPERFLQVRNRHVSAHPIKGTRPRSPDTQVDQELKKDLAKSVKDRAENIMIVDLLRNDLARTCTNIEVSELCEVHSFTHAHQLISTITGQLQPTSTPLDVFQAAFPGGSMTGAPKQSSMDILRRLENQPRGYYSGAMGYISATGDADFSILIRTIELQQGLMRYGAGGAITALSDPDDEYDEVLVKLRPFIELCESARACH